MGFRGGGGAGVGEDDPFRLREEKDGMSGLPTDITRRLPEAGGGEGRMWRGPSLVHHGDDGEAQVSRKLKETQQEGLEWLQSQD